MPELDFRTDRQGRVYPIGRTPARVTVWDLIPWRTIGEALMLIALLLALCVA